LAIGLAWGAAAWAADADADLTVPTVQPLIVTAGQPLGPGVSTGGTAQYGVTALDIGHLPAGTNGGLTDVLSQMPSVSIDQNQQIHIRDTEGPQFQYQINGVLVPLDINTNPPFLSMINPGFIKALELNVGVLPARYSYATGGVVDIETKDGCQAPGGEVGVYAGQRGVLQPSAEIGGCDGKFSYYVNGLYSQSNLAFSSATPGPDAFHDWTNGGQAFGYFSLALDDRTKLSLILSGAASDNQLPNVPGLAPQFALAGATIPPSEKIGSSLDFRDALAIVALNGSSDTVSYQLAYAAHYISEVFRPDDVGELAYQGVASHAAHDDTDNTLEGDIAWERGAHTLSAGFYGGLYHVVADDNSLVFPVDPVTGATGTSPITVANNEEADNFVGGVYVNDLWQATPQLRINLGLRWDVLTGFSHGEQLDPTVNVAWTPDGATTLHAGFSRSFQVPSFQGISPTAQAAFANTTAAGPPGIATPVTEDDLEWDVGVVHHLTPRLTLSSDNYFELTRHYLDTGQFGVVPIFAPFNYQRGYIWGSELAIDYKGPQLSAYANLTIGRNEQKGVATGQFNFDPDELAFIDAHHIVLDHQPLAGASAGASYAWGGWRFGADAVYSSGLRAGFADLEKLPQVVQVNLSLERSFRVPGVGKLTDRLVAVNAFDRTNLIRPAEGIGIFQSAYGPRLSVFDALTLAF
jgi:outer membrane receptor protein involved in Fe transport